MQRVTEASGGLHGHWRVRLDLAPKFPEQPTLGEIVEVAVHRHQAHPEPCGEIVDPRLTDLDDVIEDLLATLLDGGIGRPRPRQGPHPA
jgi:hypothetical protein